MFVRLAIILFNDNFVLFLNRFPTCKKFYLKSKKLSFFVNIKICAYYRDPAFSIKF